MQARTAKAWLIICDFLRALRKALEPPKGGDISRASSRNLGPTFPGSLLVAETVVLSRAQALTDAAAIMTQLQDEALRDGQIITATLYARLRRELNEIAIQLKRRDIR